MTLEDTPRVVVKALFEGSISRDEALSAIQRFMMNAARTTPGTRERSERLVREWLDGQYATEADMHTELLMALVCADVSRHMGLQGFTEDLALSLIAEMPLEQVRNDARYMVPLLSIDEYPNPEDIVMMRAAISRIDTSINRAEFFSLVMGVVR